MEAEVTRDEFGGYCCKRWGKQDDQDDHDNICKLLGIDVEAKALLLIQDDILKRKKLCPSPSTPATTIIQTPTQSVTS